MPGGVLVVSPFDAREFLRGGALERNRLVLELADEVFTPYIRPGGELENMLKEGGWLWEKKY